MVERPHRSSKRNMEVTQISGVKRRPSKINSLLWWDDCGAIHCNVQGKVFQEKLCAASNDRRLRFERNCVLHCWESETLK